MDPSIPFNGGNPTWASLANGTDTVRRQGALRFRLIGGLIYNCTMTATLAGASWGLFTWLLTP